MNIPIPAALTLTVLLAVFGYIMPHLTRPDLFFAVTMPPDFRGSQAGRRLLRRYRLWVGAGLLVSAALVVASASTGNGWAAAVGLLLQMAAATYALVDAHRLALPHATASGQMREAQLIPRRVSPSILLWALGPLLLLAAAAFLLGAHWDRIPERVPVHWGFAGPDRWASRSPGAVYGPLLGTGIACLIMALSCVGVLYGTRRIAVIGPSAEREMRFRHIVVRLLIAIEYAIVLPVFWLAFDALKTAPGISSVVWLLPLAAAACFLIVLLRAGQGGSRLPVSGGDQGRPSQPLGDRTPDVCWKWGLFYYNACDPAILVEKRFGVGYTLNFGNRWTWIILAALVAVIVGISVLLP